jgi:hypothetical protein
MAAKTGLTQPTRVDLLFEELSIAVEAATVEIADYDYQNLIALANATNRFFHDNLQTILATFTSSEQIDLIGRLDRRKSEIELARSVYCACWISKLSPDKVFSAIYNPKTPLSQEEQERFALTQIHLTKGDDNFSREEQAKVDEIIRAASDDDFERVENAYSFSSVVDAITRIDYVILRLERKLYLSVCKECVIL